jgi:organic hydroperoxide reductase OsmC/OhrA
MAKLGPFTYHTALEWTGGRQAVLNGPELPNLEVSAPPEFGGIPHQWTPEHFYVAAAEACMLTTFLAICDISKLAVKSYRSSAKGRLEWVEGDGLRMTEVEIAPVIEITAEADRERALRLVEKAAKNCLVARSFTAPVSVHPEVVVSAPAEVSRPAA